MTPAIQALKEGLKELLAEWEAQAADKTLLPLQEIILKQNIRMLKQLIQAVENGPTF